MHMHLVITHDIKLDEMLFLKFSIRVVFNYFSDQVLGLVELQL